MNPQDDPQWRLDRCGSLGASEVASVIRTVKSGGKSADRAQRLAIKAVERLTGVPYDGYQNAAMRQGKEREPDAIYLYECEYDVDVERVGVIRHPSIKGSHASPDGLVGEHGLVEVKCPLPAAHFETLMTAKIGTDYGIQMQWQLACTGRKWCDFVSFNPEFPAAMQLWVERIPRDEEIIKTLEREVADFVSELDLKVAWLRKTYGSEAARAG